MKIVETFKFLKYIYGQLRWHLDNKIGIFKVMQQAKGVEIRQGVTIINAHRLITKGPLRVESGCFLHCGGNKWSDGNGSISFGRGCWVAQNAILYGAGEIEIGDFTGIGPSTMIFSSRDDYSKSLAKLDHIVHRFGKVKIGSYVRIFAGVIIGPGINIGDGAVIGAGSVVLKDVPPWTIAAGVPARVIGPRDKDSFDLKRKQRG